MSSLLHDESAYLFYFLLDTNDIATVSVLHCEAGSHPIMALHDGDVLVLGIGDPQIIQYNTLSMEVMKLIRVSHFDHV